MCVYIYRVNIHGLGRPNLLGRAQPRKRLGRSWPKNGWADLGPPLSFFFFGVGWTRPIKLGWASTVPTQMVAEAADGRSEVGGNLVEEKELLSLAWREVGEGTGGRNGGGVGCLWRKKKEEEVEEENLQRGEGRPRGGCPCRR